MDNHHKTRGTMHALLCRLRRPDVLVALSLAAMALLAWAVLRFHFGVRLLDAESVVRVVASAGVWAHVCYVLLLALSVVVSWLPGIPLAMAAGAMWGTTVGTLLSVLGGVLGACAAYYIGRVIGSAVVESLTGSRISPRSGVSTWSLTGFLFASRLVPLFPFDVISYAAGTARLPFTAFVAATAVGMAPPTLALCAAGDLVPNALLYGIALSAVAAALLLVLRRPHARGIIHRFFEVEPADEPCRSQSPNAPR